MLQQCQRRMQQALFIFGPYLLMTAMRKIWWALLAVLLVVAYITKPDDKTCIIEGVKAVWGPRTPNPYDKPAFFESFMDLTSKQVEVKDWVLFKQVKYKIGSDKRTVAFGAFRKVFRTVEPMEEKIRIPKMPSAK
jgi:hypothetical protein